MFTIETENRTKDSYSEGLNAELEEYREKLGCQASAPVRYCKTGQWCVNCKYLGSGGIIDELVSVFLSLESGTTLRRV